MWLRLLKNFRDHLKTIEELEHVCLQVGASDIIPDYPCIQLVRGDIADITKQNRLMGGTYNFYIDLWVRNDELDPEHGYDALHVLGEVIEPMIYEWFKELQKEKDFAVIAELTDIVSDVDGFRPLCASRFVIKIKYKITGGK